MSTITREQLRERAREKVKSLEFAVTQTAFADSRAELEEELELARIALASLEAEAVADVVAWSSPNEERTCDIRLRRHDITAGPLCTAHPAPVSVPDDVMAAMQKVARIRLDLNDFDGDKRGILDCLGDAEEALIEVVNRRAAMLQGAEPVTTANKLPANTPCKEAPEHIWLQTAGVWPENGEFSELTWCSDNQHEDDTLYVRADVVTGNPPVIPDGWVACSERMPEVGVKVLCFPVNDEPIHATYNGQVWLQDISWSVSDEPIDNVISCNVTHWMPLPAAPQQEAKNV